MKDGTRYAKKVKKAFALLAPAARKHTLPEPMPPIDQLVLSQLSWNSTPTAAARALKKLSEEMIDLNELRVSTVREIAAMIREDHPSATECARDLSKSLHDIFRREHAVSLDSLLDMGRREAKQYLESLEGVNAYVAASLMLWSLGGHAIPVSQRLLRALKKEELVSPDAGGAEVQSFLERNISAADGKLFAVAMEKLAAQKGGRTASASKARGPAVSASCESKKVAAAARRRKKK